MKHEAKLKLEKEQPEFVAEVSGLSVQDLDARLAQLAKDIQAVEDAKDADEDLAANREQVKILAAPYSEAKKALRLKTSYIVDLVKAGS